ncbi:MAG: VCBS repeat-containing protein [Planctomycetales bacterium]|nr:VCBS repeat-containing protein [Planctomycetales bacterium]
MIHRQVVWRLRAVGVAAWLCCLLTLHGCGRVVPTPSSQEQPTASLAEHDRLETTSPAAASETPNGAALTTAPGAERDRFIGPLADAYDRIDPQRDGWETEAIGAAAAQVLDRFGVSLQDRSESADADEIVTDRFTSAQLFTTDGSEVFRDELLRIVRTNPTRLSDTTGQARLVELRREFQAAFGPLQPTSIKFKVVKVNQAAGTSDVQTEVLFHADGASPREGLRELSAAWQVTWEQGGGQLRMTQIQPTNCEVVTKLHSTETTFADCTASLLASNASYHDHLLRGTDYWRSRLPRTFGLDVVANHGLAIGDVNGDQLDDLYLCQQGGLPNRLFIQQADGTLVDKSESSGTNWLDYCTSALLIDLDNDGDRDLLIATEARILMMENDGHGQFTLRAEMKNRAQTFSMSAADFDLDGDLDIYTCGYNPLDDRVRTGAMGEPVPYHDAQNGGGNLLIRNEGNWSFSDATAAVGLDQNNNRFSFAASWEDFDNDGDRDLYVANDYGRNNLYINTNGKFHDVAGELMVEDMGSGMSASWADFNRDGWLDLYVSNMFSAAGNRITYQRQFRSNSQDEIKQQFQRHARGNSLFQSDGHGGFEDVSVEAGVTIGRWAWGSRFCDLNNDGWQDIVVANGFITTADTGDL